MTTRSHHLTPHAGTALRLIPRIYLTFNTTPGIPGTYDLVHPFSSLFRCVSVRMGDLTCFLRQSRISYYKKVPGTYEVYVYRYLVPGIYWYVFGQNTSARTATAIV